MTLARLGDGRIVMHNAMALDEPSMARIDAWGTVASILVPNGFHRLDAFVMQQRYPKARVYAPSGARAAASKATPIAGSYDDVPTDGTVTLRHLEGVGAREGVMIVRSDDGVSAVFCDTLLNLPRTPGVMGLLLGPTGTVSVPRAMRVFLVKDGRAVKADLLRIAEEDGLQRLIPGHGGLVASDAPEHLRTAAARL
jgi:hypothetical protein